MRSVLQTSRGTIAWWGYLLFWPYHFGLRTKLWVQSLMTDEDPYNEILPGWYDLPLDELIQVDMLKWWAAECYDRPWALRALEKKSMLHHTWFTCSSLRSIKLRTS
jgi:hypothetical protein